MAVNRDEIFENELHDGQHVQFEPNSINSSSQDTDDDSIKTSCRPTIEPVLFLQMLGLGICAVSTQSFFMERICMSTYNNNETLCSNLTSNKHEENHIEGIYSQYSIYQTFIELGLPIIFSMFLAPWLDKYGTKFGIVLPLIGLSCSLSLYLFFSTISSPFKASLLLIASIPVSLTGGLVAFAMSAFTYIANITTTKNRTFRIAILEGCWIVGSPTGILIGAQILKHGGYQAVFLTSGCLYVLALLYTIAFVKNDKEGNWEAQPPTSVCHKLVEFFNINSFLDTVKTFFRKRSGSKRLLIVLLLLTICLRLLVWVGAMKIAYLYAREKFGWDETTFSTFTTIDGVISICGTGLLTFVGMKILKIPDTLLGVVGAISAIGGSLILASAIESFMMYCGAVAQMFSGLTSIVVRSMISKLVPHNELGKIFSFLACAEATMPLVGGSLFYLIYMKTISFFIGSVYLVFAGINGFVILLFIYFHFAMKKLVIHHVELENEESEFEEEEQH